MGEKEGEQYKRCNGIFIYKAIFRHILDQFIGDFARRQRTQLGDVAVFENRQPVTAAKNIDISTLFIQLLGVIRRLELELISKQKVENIFVPRHIAKPPSMFTF